MVLGTTKLTNLATNKTNLSFVINCYCVDIMAEVEKLGLLTTLPGRRGREGYPVDGTKDLAILEDCCDEVNAFPWKFVDGDGSISWAYNSRKDRVKDLHLNDYDAIYLSTLGPLYRNEQDFLDFLDVLEENADMCVNHPQTMKDNLDKEYLFEYEDLGLPVIPTRKIDEDESLEELREFQFEGFDHGNIIKPKKFGERAYDIERINEVDNPEDLNLGRYFDRYEGALLQPFLPDIEKGEWSLSFLDGELITAVHKARETDFCGPVKDSNRKITEYSPSEEELSWAEEVYENEDPRIGVLRMDLIEHEGSKLISELEMINPGLYIGNTHNEEKYAVKLENYLNKLVEEGYD